MINQTKRLLLTLATTAVVSGGALAPSASALLNMGPVADGETRASTQQCTMYKQWYDDDIKAGDTKSAEYYKNLAARRGCNWAQRKVRPTTTTSTTSYDTTTSTSPQPTIRG